MFTAPTSSNWDDIVAQARSLVAGERDGIANAANLSALLYHAMPDVNWVGFYFLTGDELVVGPFQGLPACVRIPLGKGVCGTAAQRRESIIVDDVHQFPGHIACDAASNSEVVVPVQRDGRVIGVLDIDSPRHARFTDQDRDALESIVRIYADSLG